MKRLLAGFAALVVLGGVALGLYGAGSADPPVYAGPLWGYVDRDGGFVIPARFEAARGFTGGRAAARQDGRWGWIDRSGAWVMEPAWLELCDPSDPPVCARDPETRKWGWLDGDGSWRVSPRYDAVWPMVDGVAAVGMRVDDGTAIKPVVHWGLMAADGTELVAPRPAGDPEAWTGVGRWGQGWMAVEQGGFWGYVDRTGAWTLRPRFTDARPFREGFAGVSGGKWTVIDRAGNVVVAPGHGLTDGAAQGRLAGPTGYHELTGARVGPRWHGVRLPVGGVGVAQRNERWTAVDVDGNQKFEPVFSRLTDYADGRALGSETTPTGFRWGVVDLDGAQITPLVWPAVDETGFHEGLAAVATQRGGTDGASSGR